MKRVLPLLALIPGVALAQLVPQGTQSFADLGIPMADGSPTGNILLATSFTIGDMVSTAAQSGVFEGLPLQSFGEVTFNISKPGSFIFKDGAFGTFRSTFIDPTHAGNTIAFFMVGNWTPGTFESRAGAGPFPSDLTISFTQTPGGNGVLSDSASFSTPAQVVSAPEPTGPFAINTLMGLGVAGVYYFTRRRK